MARLLTVNRWAAFAIFVFLDVVCVGLGMGVPIFCIALGFPVGSYVAARAVRTNADLEEVLKKTFVKATATSAVTFGMMALLWGSVIPMLFDPAADFVNFGIPMLLYEPKASFVGWLVLMIFISPFLQLLTSLFSSHLALLVWLARKPEVSRRQDSEAAGRAPRD